MSNSISNIKQYLINNDSISKQDKNYTINYCKKIEYMEQLKQVLINDLHETVYSGYGNVNSNICFVFESKEEFESIKPELQSILEKVKLNFWDVYITFVNKTESNYDNKYIYLMHEINAVSPKILYVLGKTDNSYNNINKSFTLNKINHPSDKTFFIPLMQLCELNEEKKAKLWNVFRYLINYK